MGFWVAITRNGRLSDIVSPVDGHLSLLHRLEQGSLRLGRSAVDLVGQHNVREYRSLDQLKGAVILTPYVRPQYVGGQKIGA